MAEIVLRDGSTVLVDEIDFQQFGHLTWYSSGNGYVSRRAYEKPDKPTEYLHRVIMDTPTGVLIDHINRDKRDCRRSNLRFATDSQNAQNCEHASTGSSQFRGVRWRAEYKTWRAAIRHDGNHLSLGSFTDEISAAKAYDDAARRFHGDFAILNFSQE